MKPLFDMNPTPERIARFMAKVDKRGEDQCWPWLGGGNEHGYGVFWNGERLEKAPRFSFRAFVTVLARTQVCRHTCDNPACVNPAHLVAGTTQDNVNDMWSRKRATVQLRRGVSQTQAKLDDSAAAEIRAKWAAGGVKQRELAAEFGVSQRMIWNVIHGKNWFAPSGVVIVRGVGK